MRLIENINHYYLYQNEETLKFVIIDGLTIWGKYNTSVEAKKEFERITEDYRKENSK